jgi:hypothetical protein
MSSDPPPRDAGPLSVLPVQLRGEQKPVRRAIRTLSERLAAGAIIYVLVSAGPAVWLRGSVTEIDGAVVHVEIEEEPKKPRGMFKRA